MDNIPTRFDHLSEVGSLHVAWHRESQGWSVSLYQKGDPFGSPLSFVLPESAKIGDIERECLGLSTEVQLYVAGHFPHMCKAFRTSRESSVSVAPSIQELEFYRQSAKLYDQSRGRGINTGADVVDKARAIARSGKSTAGQRALYTNVLAALGEKVETFDEEHHVVHQDTTFSEALTQMPPTKGTVSVLHTEVRDDPDGPRDGLAKAYEPDEYEDAFKGRTDVVPTGIPVKMDDGEEITIPHLGEDTLKALFDPENGERNRRMHGFILGGHRVEPLEGDRVAEGAMPQGVISQDQLDALSPQDKGWAKHLISKGVLTLLNRLDT